MPRPANLASLIRLPNGWTLETAMGTRAYWDQINQAKVFFLDGLPEASAAINYNNTRRLADHWRRRSSEIIQGAQQWQDQFPSQEWRRFNVSAHLEDALEVQPMCLVKIAQVLLLVEDMLRTTADAEAAVAGLYGGVRIEAALWTIPELARLTLNDETRDRVAEALFQAAFVGHAEARHLVNDAQKSCCLSYEAAQLIRETLVAHGHDVRVAPVRRRRRGEENPRGNAVPASPHLLWQ